MNFRLMLRMMGNTLLVEALCLLLPLGVALVYGENVVPLLASCLLIAVVGIPLSLLPADRQFFAKEGFVVVGGIWLVFCVFGALPFLFSGYFHSYIDCFFEVVSGFTTTGASILPQVEHLPKSILFWRSFTSWIGGMGVLIFTLAFLPTVGGRTHHLVEAESPGPMVSKLVPKTAQSSKILYGIYIALTLLETLCLRLAGMDWFDAVTHSFATVCTGGFSTRNLSIGAYASPAIEIIVTVFMLLCALNFALYFLVLTGRLRLALQSDEARFFLGVVTVSVLLIFVNLQELHIPLGDSLRHAAFQVASIITTTGFSSTDFDLWPEFSRVALVVLMFLGGCAGSTAGGLKASRILLLLRCIRREIAQISHPRSVRVVKLDGKAVAESKLHSVMVFFACYLLIVGVGCLVVGLDNLPFATTVTSVISSVGNVGPGLAAVGPMGNYAVFSDLSKLVLSLCMLIGRLEIFPILVLFSPATWGRS